MPFRSPLFYAAVSALAGAAFAAHAETDRETARAAVRAEVDEVCHGFPIYDWRLDKMPSIV